MLLSLRSQIYRYRAYIADLTGYLIQPNPAGGVKVIMFLIRVPS
jgi:hypothetical protein